MKKQLVCKFFLLGLGVFQVFNAAAQNVGIGTTAPNNYNHGGANRILEVYNPGFADNSQSHLMLTDSAVGGSVGSITWASRQISFYEKRLGAIIGAFDPIGPFPAGVLRFYVNAPNGNAFDERLTINGYGNIGVGVPAPTAQIHLSNRVNNRKIVLYDVSNTNHQFFGFGIDFNTLRYQVDAATADHVFFAGNSSFASTELMRIKGNGFVGIGTSTPNATLQLSNTLELRKLVLREIANNDYQFSGFGTTFNTLRYQTSSPNEDHVFSAAATASSSNELMRIKGNGFVGIGTPQPSSPLEVVGRISVNQIYSGGYGGLLLRGQGAGRNYGNIGFSTVSGILGPDVVGALISGDIISNTPGAEAIDLTFHTSNSSFSSLNEKLRIKGNGNVGIGTNNPQNLLEVVAGPSANATKVVIANRGGFGPAALEFVSDYGTSSQWRPGYIASNDLGGFTGRLEFFTNGTGSNNLYGAVKGFEVRNGAALTATGSVGSYSDLRLKENIVPFTDGLNVIEQLNPVLFQYKAGAPFDTQEQQVGIVAQDLEKAAPYMVNKVAENGVSDLRWVNNQAYVFLLINAVKALQQQNEQQQQQIEELSKRLEKITCQDAGASRR